MPGPGAEPLPGEGPGRRRVRRQGLRGQGLRRHGVIVHQLARQGNLPRRLFLPRHRRRPGARGTLRVQGCQHGPGRGVPAGQPVPRVNRRGPPAGAEPGFGQPAPQHLREGSRVRAEGDGGSRQGCRGVRRRGAGCGRRARRGVGAGRAGCERLDGAGAGPDHHRHTPGNRLRHHEPEGLGLRDEQAEVGRGPFRLQRAAPQLPRDPDAVLQPQPVHRVPELRGIGRVRGVGADQGRRPRQVRQGRQRGEEQ